MQMVGTKVSDETLAVLKMKASIAGQTVSSYMRDLISRDIDSHDYSHVAKRSQEIETTAEIRELSKDIDAVKQLLIKLAKSSVVATVIAESQADEVLKLRAREIATKFVGE
jgi:hypothetical protein